MFIKIGSTYVNPRTVCRVMVTPGVTVADRDGTRDEWRVVVFTSDGGSATTSTADPSRLVADLESLAEHGRTQETIEGALRVCGSLTDARDAQ